jgi:hypothetical protein
MAASFPRAGVAANKGRRSIDRNLRRRCRLPQVRRLQVEHELGAWPVPSF